MSFSVPPVSNPYPTPLVAESRSATDRRRAREEADRRRPPHHQPETPAVEDPAAATPEPEAGPSIGTLINVRA